MEQIKLEKGFAVDNVFDSFERLNAQGTVFYDRFYQEFIASDPRIGRYFSSTNLTQLERMVSKTLTHAVLYTCNPASQTAPENLVRLIEDHKEMRIEPALFDIWQDSLLKCIHKYDPEINDDLLEEWNICLTRLVNLFKRALMQIAS
ncbi:globin [Colwellia sp. MEBiC06753]